MGTVGVVIGKFNPPHLGHLLLVRKAAASADQVVVLLCHRTDQTLSGELRRAWLLEDCPPNVEVVLTPDDLPAANAPWAKRAVEILGRAPDLAFTSEDWGPGWAAEMGARHIEVDRQRSSFPISATELRADLGATFHWLIPGARAAMARRVVLVGAESTGKSTLASALAEALRTVWVPEYGRSYWEGRRHLINQEWTGEEFRHIAVRQHELVADLARKAHQGIVVCDTDALMTAVWMDRYLGEGDPALEELAREHPPALYLICAPDFPWVQDGTRESQNQRADMHLKVLRRVEEAGIPFALLAGPPGQRLDEALALTRPLTRFEPLT